MDPALLLNIAMALGGVIAGAGAIMFRRGAEEGKILARLEAVENSVKRVHTDLFGNGSEPKFVRTSACFIMEEAMSKRIEKLEDRVFKIEQ